MSRIKFKIDEKSLWYGVYNDYDKGQSAIVHTPLNQAKSEDKWRRDIMKLFDYSQLTKSIPERLKDICVPKTTSNANSEIDYFYEFDNLLLDGTELDCEYGFGMYVKREVDKIITKRDGTRSENTHYGRLKLHYPTKLSYKSDGFNVDNHAVLEAILKANGGFAFIVRGFEIDTDKRTLNFITSIIGPNGVHLSTIFRRQKGVGKKLLLKESSKSSDTNKISITESNDNLLIQEDYQSAYDDTDFEAQRQIQVQNGQKGEQYVLENFEDIIGTGCHDIFHTSKIYAKSPYDIEYIDENGTKQYIEVKSSSTSRKAFHMSKYEIRFMQKYQDSYTLILVTEVNNTFPTIHKYTYEQIMKMQKEYPTTKFIV